MTHGQANKHYNIFWLLNGKTETNQIPQTPLRIMKILFPTNRITWIKNTWTQFQHIFEPGTFWMKGVNNH